MIPSGVAERYGLSLESKSPQLLTLMSYKFSNSSIATLSHKAYHVSVILCLYYKHLT